MLSAASLLAGCGTPAHPPAATTMPEGDRHTRTSDEPIVDLSPAQALGPQAQRARVRWRGGINAIETSEGGRQCFTLLQATFDTQQVLQWPRDPQYFVACGPGRYDPELVTPFTLVSLDGRVSGQQMFLGKPIPVIEIEALYRHSDCLQGHEQDPGCYAGHLQPEKP